MRIPLLVRKKFDELMPFVILTIRSAYVRRIIPILAVVDTGSPWTALTPEDTLKLNIPIKSLHKAEKFVRVGFAGSSFWRCLLPDVTIYMKTDTGETAKFSLPSISVLLPMKGKLQKFKGIPSVLGCNFITSEGFKLCFNPSKNVAFLEKEEI